MNECITNEQQINAMIGIDIGDRYSSICVLAQGEPTQHSRVRTSRAAMGKFLQRSRAHVVIEVGAHSRWLSQLCKEHGHKTTVANPRAVMLIAKGQRKSDRRDAELLARLGKVDTELLSPIEHRDDNAQSELAVLKARDQLVQVRTSLKLHILGVLKSYGIKIPRSSGGSFLRHVEERMPAELSAALVPLCKSIEQMNEKIRGYDKHIEQMAKNKIEVVAIEQINGVGALTALAFVLTLEDAGRFAKSRDVGAYFGLVPKRCQSGDADPQLRITKTGDPFVRKLLVQAANYILGPFGKPSDLREYGMRIAARGGARAKKRAVIAVARKLAVLMHRIWVTGEVYEPIGYHHKQMAA